MLKSIKFLQKLKMKKNSFYITTTLPYVNSDPHIGFAMEIIRADVIARYKKLLGFDVFFNTGTDEHGQKLFDSAEEEGISVEEYIDRNAKKFKDLINLLNISQDVHFIRTTDKHHIKAAQEFWRICKNNGFIYKKEYQTKYCVGCELEKTDSELDETGQCIIHPNNKIELRNEENYFFKFSDFQKPLINFYEKNPDFVIPDFRFNEIKTFVKNGIEDFSISRLKSKMSWGVPVPDDDEHVMYVWFDALVNYISTLGWPEDKENFEKYWANGNPVQYCGKDNLRQQSAMWQAMLMAVKLPNTKNIIIDGFITGEGGVKMSKSIGNVINPSDIVAEYGTDALRYFLLREVSSFEDSPFTIERFKEAYNSGLANGLGNLVSRVMKMATTYDFSYESLPNREDMFSNSRKMYKNTDYKFDWDYFETFEIKKVIDSIWARITGLDFIIQAKKPFALIKTNPVEATKDLQQLVTGLYFIAFLLEPIMPETSEKIIKLILERKMPEQPLFLRKE